MLVTNNCFIIENRSQLTSSIWLPQAASKHVHAAHRQVINEHTTLL